MQSGHERFFAHSTQRSHEQNNLVQDSDPNGLLRGLSTPSPQAPLRVCCVSGESGTSVAGTRPFRDSSVYDLGLLTRILVLVASKIA